MYNIDIVADIGDITGPIALVITLIWWFGLTPKRIAHLVREHKLLYKTWNVILPTSFIGLALYFGIFHFVTGPLVVDGNKWAFGGFWILISLYFTVRTEERHIRYFITLITRGMSLEILGTVLMTMTLPLLYFGLNMPLKLALITLAYAIGVTAIIVMVIFFIARRFKTKASK